MNKAEKEDVFDIFAIIVYTIDVPAPWGRGDPAASGAFLAFGSLPGEG
jgi:hypothetical protein